MGALTLPTEVEGLVLRAHVPDDADALRQLLHDNSAHLLASGDYGAEIVSTVAYWREEFAANGGRSSPPYSFGMWLDGAGMVGRIVLVPVEPPRYGVGYWVAKPQQGKGFATAGLRALVAYAGSLGASDVYAGVNHGNPASRRVLEHCGFVETADFDSYTRFHRSFATL
jgi:RimJ/RimL family protein N-acetyltransferase